MRKQIFQDKAKFKELFRTAIELIAYVEGKRKGQIEKEFATITNRSIFAIQSWLKDDEDSPIPDGPIVKILANEIWKRHGFSTESDLEAFLRAAGFPHAKNISELIIKEHKNKKIWTEIQKSKISKLDTKIIWISIARYLQKYPPELFLRTLLLLTIVVRIMASIVTVSLNPIDLATWYGNPVVVENPGGFGNKITASFTITNASLHIVIIKTLALGTNGPGITCQDSLQKRWGTQGRYTFRPAFLIVLFPGQEYKYTSSAIFPEKGDYFVEPVIQSFDKGWGGIQPFTCVDFSVG